MLTLVETFRAFQVAAAGYVLTLLFQDGQIFAFWGRLLARMEWRFPNLSKMLGGCARCFTGQLALFTGALYLRLCPFTLLWFIALSIFFQEIVQIYDRKNQTN